MADNETNVSAFTLNGNLTGATAFVSWSAEAVISLFIFICAFFANSGLLLLFVKERTLRTPFHVYLINLLIANLSCLVLRNPLTIIGNVYDFVWHLGEDACTVFLYASFVLEGVVVNAHQLIAINRIWAVVYPLSYRSIHNCRSAFVLCVGMWLYVHIAMVPGLVVDIMYYRKPVDLNGCTLNAKAQPVWNIITELVVFDIPQLVILLAFSIIYVNRKRQRQRTRARMIAQPSFSVRERHDHDSSINGRRVEPTGDHSQPGPTVGRSVVSLPRLLQQRRQNSQGYFVLALLTISATICYTPINTEGILVTFVNYHVQGFFQVGDILFSCQMMLDPFLFVAGLDSVRHSLRRICSRA